jgi:hypothetical protein
MLLIVAGCVPLLLIGGSASSSDIATATVLLLCGVPIVATIEVIIRRCCARANARQVFAAAKRAGV